MKLTELANAGVRGAAIAGAGLVVLGSPAVGVPSSGSAHASPGGRATWALVSEHAQWLGGPQRSAADREPEGRTLPVEEPAKSRRRAVIRVIPDSQWTKMRRAGVVRAGCPAGRKQLRRVEVWHVGFDGRARRGVLVVNADVARDVAGVFDDLFRARFPIRSIRPIEDFAGDDNASMAADNTAAYNCRRPGQANAPAARSPHANGRAVDLNPRENPWWDPRCSCFQPAARHAPRTAGKGKILRGGVVWRAFTKRGWLWQNIATPDYQHFDTGYPSRPR